MRLAVVGVGGLGGYFGARLAQAQNDVRFLARGRHLEALRIRGLRVQSVFGDFALAPAQVPAADDPHQIGPVDVVLFTVKSFDTEAAARLLPPLLRPDPAVISLQNGIDNEEKLGAEIGAEHVVGGAAYVFAELVEPGVVRHSGGPTRLVFGEFDGRPSARLEVFRAACLRAGFGAEIVADIRAALWTKYAFICAQAGTTAAVRQPIGVIRETPATWALFRRIVEETWRVGRAEGVRLPDDLVQRQLDLAARIEPANYSSLHDDLVAGRRMELDALLGELVRRGARAGVPTPAAETLYAVLRPWADRGPEPAER
ncbi:MAG: 2-dehydropantoate 2-reductase [Candidatus Limnocylindrales bacterium]